MLAQALTPQARAAQAAGNDSTLTYSIKVCSTSPLPTDTAIVTVTKPFKWIMLGPALSLFGAGAALPANLTGKAVMKCGG